MTTRRAVLFRGAAIEYRDVGCRDNGEAIPYVMFANNLYVRAEQADQHGKGGRIIAYRFAEYYEVRGGPGGSYEIGSSGEVPHDVITCKRCTQTLNSKDEAEGCEDPQCPFA